VGSDNWPLFIDSDENQLNKQRNFYFEEQWLMEEDFNKVFSDNWNNSRSRFHENMYSIDIWYGCLGLVRQFLKGWSSNKTAEEKKNTMLIIAKLGELDLIGETGDMDAELWVERYRLEVRLEHMFHKEEIFWQQMSSKRWVTKGDANTSLFHKSANGRRRKSRICSLEVDDGTIDSLEEIKAHIVELYKNLFGADPCKGAKLAKGIWE
jgi:hypothetical protein